MGLIGGGSSSGGASGGGASMPSFPWEISQSGNWKVSEEKMSKERFIQECSIILFGNVDFKNCGMPVETVATDCVVKAQILAEALKKIHG